jgi:osmotically-inducible protein OsmY
MTHQPEPPGEPVQYVVAHVREVLANDDRVGALDLGIKIVGRAVFLTGWVTTPERLHAAEDVVREVLPDHDVHNQLHVLSQDPPTDSESVG